MHQSKYASDLVTKFNMLDCKPCLTPCSPTVNVSSQVSPLLPDPTVYRSMVGALQYLTFTRPDLSYSASLSVYESTYSTPLDGSQKDP